MFDLLFTGFAIFGLAAAWVMFWSTKYFARPEPDSIEFARTADNWRLALLRYRPSGESKKNLPVILCHGLASNALTWDPDISHSLARHLAYAGYEVFAVELRGRGFSDRPRLFSTQKYGWDFDTYLNIDLPALIHRVKELTGKDQVHWAGHSMGGNLIYTYLGWHDQSVIRSATAIASSLDYSDSKSAYHRLARLRKYTRIKSVYFIMTLQKLEIPFVGRIANKVERFLFWEKNMNADLIRKFYAHCFCDISNPVLHQKATLFHKGGIRSADESISYFQGLKNIRTPMLSICGAKDSQCPPDATKKTHDAIEGCPKKFLEFGKAVGHKEEYGHFDLIVGENSKHEVWPEILAWLDKYDTAEP